MTLVLLALATVVNWENPAVNSENRLPPRTYAMPLASEQAAFTDALEPETPWKRSLNGQWKISWAGRPQDRVLDFWKCDFDDSAWSEIDVPSCVEMRGFGCPGYTNVAYPHKKEAPKILDNDTGKPDYNPVSSYRTRFTVPADWAGRRIILRFDGVYSAYYVWVNGKKVGYAEDSKLPSEFDITDYVKFSNRRIVESSNGSQNILAVEVYRWCDGSYLEDQDMFRFSGIFRDVTLWSMPKDGIWDFSVVAGADGRIELSGLDGEWSAALYDAAKNKVAALTPAAPSAILDAVELWSAEKPVLYTLVVKKGDDVRMRRVGFKGQKIVGHTMLVNGKPIKFKGVNRHETNPDNGRTVSMDDMLADIRLMKRYNINTVRTSHYPDHHLWYDLCDRYGIYLVAEANVEGHAYGYKEEGLGGKPEWDHSIVERNERQAVFYRNHPSITIWSMGNETGHGDCFRHAIAAVRKIDPTRPIHWERGNADADLDSTMYPSPEWLEKRGRSGDGKLEPGEDPVQTPNKAFFMCEYAHAMGNAIGNFQEYWDAFYRYESLSGGCIWDWVDQAIWKYTDRVDPKTGKRERFLAYGGDFDEQPNDGPFCVNGVVDPFRTVTAKLVEVGHVHRNLVVTRSETTGGNGFAIVFELWNRFGFTRADEFVGCWKLREDGEVTKTGCFAPPAAEPLSRCRFTVPGLAEALAGSKTGAELFVDFEFSLKDNTLWAEKGWVVARDQVELGVGCRCRCTKDGENSAVGLHLRPTPSSQTPLTISVGGTKAEFSRVTGTLSKLEMNGKTILSDEQGVCHGPLLTCSRAFTDNDIWMRDRTGDFNFYVSGLTQLRYHPHPIEVGSNAVKVVTEVTGRKSAGFVQTSLWQFAEDGSVTVANRVEMRGVMPSALPRLGLSLKLDKSLERMRYYGRGPRENYIDRKTGSFLGVWESTVTDQFEPYVRPQDNGGKCDVRWVEFADEKGRGVRFSASEPLFVQALHFTAEDLEFARHRNHQQRFRAPLVPRDEVCLNLDVRQTGLGGNSCGPRPMKKYIYKPGEPVEWTVRIEPTKK